MEAIILAGGLGTRLSNLLPDTPKCLAPINNKPFIDYLLKVLINNDIKRVVFALGYKSQMFIDYFKSLNNIIEIDYTIEHELLGTGGAIKLALSKTTEKNILVLNGDTFFNCNYKNLLQFHINKNSECSLFLKKMINYDRYGTVLINSESQIVGFKEKSLVSEGLINTGNYIINTQLFCTNNFNNIFSFEKDYLESNYSKNNFFGLVDEGDFIDIGIPEDYLLAKNLLAKF
jgi:D-glycero-alpha-D-manno-heptose 1-phosphate guanylyltransferase